MKKSVDPALLAYMTLCFSMGILGLSYRIFSEVGANPNLDHWEKAAYFFACLGVALGIVCLLHPKSSESLLPGYSPAKAL